jgi:hypothetical protein
MPELQRPQFQLRCNSHYKLRFRNLRLKCCFGLQNEEAVVLKQQRELLAERDRLAMTPWQ